MTLNLTTDLRSLHDVVRSIVVEELELEPDELVGTASFEEDYDADSLSLLAILARFENELKITIPNERIGEMTSFDELLAVVDEYDPAARV